MYVKLVHSGLSKVSALNGHISGSVYKTGSTVPTFTGRCFHKKIIYYVNGYTFFLHENMWKQL